MKEKLNPLLRRVTLKQLRVLAAVTRSGTMSAAADALAVTPPAVTLQLRLLEETFGLAAGRAHRRRACGPPTPAGRCWPRPSGSTLALVECAEAIQALRGMEGGRVAVGVISTAKYFAPFALAAFKRQHPRIDLRVMVGNRQEMLAALEGFDLDLAITGRPPEHFEVERAVIGDHPHVIIAPPDHPLAGKGRVALADLAGEPFLLREAGSGTRTLVQTLMVAAGLDPTVGMEIGSNETIKQAVMAGMGIAFLSAHTVAAEVTDRRLAVLEVEGLPVVRQWFVVKRREKRLLPAAKALWDHLAAEGGRFLPDTTAFLPHPAAVDIGRTRG